MTIEFSISIPSTLNTQAKIIEATNAWLSLLNTGEVTNKKAEVFLADYADLTWENRSAFPPEPIGDEPEVVSWGVKMLPGAGAFYFANFDDETHVIDHIPDSNPSTSD